MMFHKQLEYQDPKLIYPHMDDGLSFDDYRIQCKEMIRHHRHDLSSNAQLKIDANAPDEFKPTTTLAKNTRYGALLIHGLFDSPFVMRDIGHRLANHGLLVRSILLPGHGTVPGALLNVSYQDWLQTLRYGIASFKKEVDQLFLVGFSIGGALAIRERLSSTDDFISGLLLCAPALQIKCKSAIASQYLVRLAKYYRRAQWIGIQEEMDYVKYRSTATNAVYQSYQLMKEIKQLNKYTHSCPQFLALSLNDKTVESSASINYFSNYSQPKNQMLLYTNHRIKMNDTRITTRNSAYPEQRILDLSHIGLPIAPTNPHYGKNGDYPFASHLEDNQYWFDEIRPTTISLYKLLNQLKLSRYLRQRLTFNPDFEFLMQKMLSFIDGVIS